MPSNLFERRNQFRLYDIEGVLLSPNDYIVINEPEDFGEFKITIERDSDKHGLFYEFGGEDETLGFDRVKFDGEPYSPFVFIKAIQAQKGIDSKIQFEFLNYDGVDYVSQYLSDLDFETYNEEDYKVTINVRRVLLGDVFRTRIETPVDFSKTESIDGVPITGLTSESMYFHGKIINREGDLEVQDPLQSGDFPVNQRPLTGGSPIVVSNTTESINTASAFGFDDRQECTIPFFKENINNIEGLFALNASVLGVEGSISSSPIVDNNIFFMGGADFIGGKYSINFNFDFCISIVPTLFDDPVTPVDVSVTLVRVDRFNETIEEIIILSDSTSISFGTPTDRGAFLPTNGFNDGFFHGFYSVSYSNEFDLRDKERVFLKIEVIDPAIQDGYKPIFYFSDGDLDIQAQQVQEGSNVDTYKLFESTNHVIESITDQTNVLESSFLQNNALPVRMTNGYKIRNFEQGDTRVNPEVKTNFKDHFEKFLQPVFGLGYAIYENSGVFKVLLEKYETFYQDVEMDFINTIQDGSYSLEYDKDLIFNEAIVGYKDFPKATDENKENNIDEVNTQHNILFPIKSVKKKANYLSDYISSGYKIENQRREQFKDKPSDTVTDDDKLFAVTALSSNNYTDLSVDFIGAVIGGNLKIIKFKNATYIDLQDGDQFTVSGSSGNNTTYTVSSTSLSGVDLQVKTVENVTTEINSTGVTITRNSTRLRAARDEEFQSISNVVDTKTVYNTGLNPKYMLKNHSLLLNSGFVPKTDTEKIKTSDVKLNSDMNCQFKSGQGLYNVNPERLIDMSSDIELKDFNNYNKLFSGFLIKFTASITYDRVLSIRNNYLNQGNQNYGYIRIETPDGSERSGYLMSMTYNPLNEQADFILRERFVPGGDNFDYVLDFELA
jgi:hypothetical protein